MSTEIHYVETQKPPKSVFFAAVVMVFFCTVSAADSVGFVPYYIDGSAPMAAADEVPLSDLPMLGEPTGISATASSTVATFVGVLPARIKIPGIDLDLPVQNPDTRNIATLDVLLQKGPARYVDSAKLGESGNMIIFAHSSHLPIVRNKMFQAFNRIPELKSGDSITVVGKDGKDYLYSVTSVRTADVDEVTIDLSVSQGTKLTLVTCDTLTSKSSRYILEAELIGQL